MTLTPPPTEVRQPRRRQRRDPEPHFKPDTSRQLDAIEGCPSESVPPGHLAWAVLEPRALTVSPAAEAMRDRLARPGARERYNRRIATVEPVFSNIEASMGYRRVSSRLPETVKAEILLKILAHNVSRLIVAKRLRAVHLVVGPF